MLNASLIRERRARLRITQAELAEHAEISQASVSQIECGEIEAPAYPIIVRIARALGVTPEELFPVPETSTAFDIERGPA